MCRIVWLLVAAVLVAATGGAGWAWRDHRAAERLDAQCDDVTSLNERRGDAPVGDGQTSAVILGDSYAQGQYLDDPRGQAWSTLAADELDWTATVDAVGGTGLLAEGPCQGQSIPDRAANALAGDPEVVVIQTGLNDDATTAEAGALRQVIQQTGDARVIVVGPTSPPKYDANQAEAIDRVLRDAAEAVGAEYVSALGWDLSYGSDSIHMTAAGHRAYAENFARAVD